MFNPYHFLKHTEWIPTSDEGRGKINKSSIQSNDFNSKFHTTSMTFTKTFPLEYQITFGYTVDSNIKRHIHLLMQCWHVNVSMRWYILRNAGTWFLINVLNLHIFCLYRSYMCTVLNYLNFASLYKYNAKYAYDIGHIGNISI